jgi:hypothetical protein
MEAQREHNWTLFVGDPFSPHQRRIDGFDVLVMRSTASATRARSAEHHNEDIVMAMIHGKLTLERQDAAFQSKLCPGLLRLDEARFTAPKGWRN